MCAARGARCAAILARRGTEAAGGRIDILVNNAGGGAFGPTAGFGEDAFDATFGTNVKAPFYLVGDIAPAMAERGQGASSTWSPWRPSSGCQAWRWTGPARRP